MWNKKQNNKIPQVQEVKSTAEAGPAPVSAPKGQNENGSLPARRPQRAPRMRDSSKWEEVCIKCGSADHNSRVCELVQKRKAQQLAQQVAVVQQPAQPVVAQPEQPVPAVPAPEQAVSNVSDEEKMLCAIVDNDEQIVEQVLRGTPFEGVSNLETLRDYILLCRSLVDGPKKLKVFSEWLLPSVLERRTTPRQMEYVISENLGFATVFNVGWLTFYGWRRVLCFFYLVLPWCSATLFVSAVSLMEVGLYMQNGKTFETTAYLAGIICSLCGLVRGWFRLVYSGWRTSGITTIKAVHTFSLTELSPEKQRKVSVDRKNLGFRAQKTVEVSKLYHVKHSVKLYYLATPEGYPRPMGSYWELCEFVAVQNGQVVHTGHARVTETGSAPFIRGSQWWGNEVAPKFVRSVFPNAWPCMNDQHVDMTMFSYLTSIPRLMDPNRSLEDIRQAIGIAIATNGQIANNYSSDHYEGVNAATGLLALAAAQQVKSATSARLLDCVQWSF